MNSAQRSFVIIFDGAEQPLKCVMCLIVPIKSLITSIAHFNASIHVQNEPGPQHFLLICIRVDCVNAALFVFASANKLT